MPSRLIPAILTLVVLVSCYLAYDTLAVPALHGPPAPPVQVVQPAQPQVRELALLFGELIAPIFPEGSWERSCDIVLRNEQILLFVGGYQQLDDRRLQISPCTIVLRPHGFESPTGPDNRTWIMQAPGKTILQMEHDADIRRGSLGRIVSAYIPGEVNIRCEETEPGAGDQVELATTHVQISDQQIWTPHDVRFRWGANFGVGTDLTIRFSDLQTSRGRVDGLPQALPAGIRSIELVRLARLHIESPGKAGGRADGPVEITCQGALKLDMLGGLARMSQNVKIERFVPGGQVDALQCDELTTRFSSTRRPGRSGRALQFERVVATGQPATVTSLAVSAASAAESTSAHRAPPPQHHFAAARMEYDLLTGEFLSGPGEYKTQIKKDSAAGQPDEFETVEVIWQKSMRWQNAEAGKLLTLDGSAECSFGPNRILCNRLRMWFDEPSTPRVTLATQPAQVPIPSQRSGAPGLAASAPTPRRVIADGHVQINTLPMVGSTERLDVVLKPTSAALGATDSPPDRPAADEIQLRPPDNDRSGSHRSTGSASRLRVYGQTMRLMVERAGNELRLRDVNIDGNVLCSTEGESGGRDRPAIKLQGTTLLIRDLDATSGVATIAGAPAKIRGRGMDISGPTINLDRTRNRVWIDGAGSATLPLPRTIAARYPRDAAFAYVVWQDGMSFDGKTIRCVRNVHIRGPAQMIRAAQLEVTLNHSIDFSRTNIQDADVDLQRITADGGVTIENRALSARGLESIDSAAVETFTIEYPSGQVMGQGPGWIETVRMGKNVGTIGKPAAAAADSLIYLRVEFQRQMRANLTQRQAEFTDRIQGTFGPVEDWKDRIVARDAAALDEGQLLMNCDRLTLFQIKNGRPGKAPVELVAEGNATIEGNQFTARAHRMSYDQGKDLFLMVGAARAPARLWRQTRPGVPRPETVANRIQYSPTSGALKMDGVQMLELGNLGGP